MINSLLNLGVLSWMKYMFIIPGFQIYVCEYSKSSVSSGNNSPRIRNFWELLCKLKDSFI